MSVLDPRDTDPARAREVYEATLEDACGVRCRIGIRASMRRYAYEAAEAWGAARNLTVRHLIARDRQVDLEVEP
jgi:hypothetical protein